MANIEALLSLSGQKREPPDIIQLSKALTQLLYSWTATESGLEHIVSRRTAVVPSNKMRS